MKPPRRQTGVRGEDAACRFLEERGHRIVARNWRNAHLEIDIISLSGNELHIVEVKSRVAPIAAAPETNVDRTKRRRLTAAAGAFLHSDRMRTLPSDLDVYFDVVTVVFNGQDIEIEYYPKAFVPIYA